MVGVGVEEEIDVGVEGGNRAVDIVGVDLTSGHADVVPDGHAVVVDVDVGQTSVVFENNKHSGVALALVVLALVVVVVPLPLVHDDVDDVDIGIDIAAAAAAALAVVAAGGAGDGSGFGFGSAGAGDDDVALLMVGTAADVAVAVEDIVVDVAVGTADVLAPETSVCKDDMGARHTWRMSFFTYFANIYKIG